MFQKKLSEFEMKFIEITLLFTFLISLTSFLSEKGNKIINPENGFLNFPDNPKELGFVNWIRNYDEAINHAKAENKSVLILFQEIPGCNTCVTYGQQILTNPLIVDAIQNLFIPLAIYNNRDGEDLKALERFNEPAWNNPVVRIISKDGSDAAKRVNGDYSIIGITEAMIEALNHSNRPVPLYLQLLNQEAISRTHDLKSAVFAMYCFWEGEANLGELNGVISTKPGFANGSESVEVRYDPSIISFDELKNIADKNKCSITKSDKFKSDSEPKYYLSQTDLKYVPMTPMQAARINSAISNKKDPAKLLSPTQVELYDYIKHHTDRNWKNYIGTDNLQAAWQEVIDKIKS